MGSIVAFHSFRGGTGKSNTTANVSWLLAAAGRRVGVIDADIQSPGVHILFGLEENPAAFSLNDFLWGQCKIEEAAVDITAKEGLDGSGALYLIPSSLQAEAITRVLREGYDVGLLNTGLRSIVASLALDVLLIDTHPGLNEETLLALALTDHLVIVLRPDQQDYMGTSITVELARKLEVPDIRLLVNNVPAALEPAKVQERVEQAYGCSVAAIVPHSPDMLALASGGIFVNRYPKHVVTLALRQLAESLV